MTIEGLALDTLGPVAIAGIAVLLVLSGRLIPRNVHDKIVANRDKQIEDWRNAAEERSAQLTQLLAATDTSTRAIEALTEVTGVRRKDTP